MRNTHENFKQETGAMKTEVMVKAYSGFKTNERPVSFQIGNENHFVDEIIDNWIGEKHAFWKVLTDRKKKFLLKYDPEGRRWEVEPFRQPHG